MNIIQSNKEIEISQPNSDSTIVIKKFTLFEVKHENNSVVLVEVDRRHDYIVGGNYITFSEENWSEYRASFSCL